MRHLAILVGALALAACDASGGDLFIATQSDFQTYAGWEKLELGVAMNMGHPVGPEFGYRNRPAQAGAYSVGSILVKEIQIGDLPQQWELFGMAKRGGGYNPSGARDWEFFTLALNEDLVPIIVSRGSNPSDGDAQGHGYATSADGTTCNRCHGVLGTETTDHVLSIALAP